MVGNGRRARRQFTEQPTVLRDLPGQTLVGAWIDLVQAGADHGDGGAGERIRRLQSALVRRAIDAQRQARHHTTARCLQTVREGPRVVAALRGGVAAAHDGYAGVARTLELTLGKQHRRRVVQCQQSRRVLRIAPSPDRVLHTLSRLRQPGLGAGAQCQPIGRLKLQGLHLRVAEHLLQGLWRLRQHGLHRAKSLQELAQGLRADAGGLRQAQPQRPFGQGVKAGGAGAE